jgi:hypothetical protein
MLALAAEVQISRSRTLRCTIPQLRQVTQPEDWVVNSIDSQLPHVSIVPFLPSYCTNSQLRQVTQPEDWVVNSVDSQLSHVSIVLSLSRC